jgi:hypothetical protein
MQEAHVRQWLADALCTDPNTMLIEQVREHGRSGSGHEVKMTFVLTTWPALRGGACILSSDMIDSVCIWRISPRSQSGARVTASASDRLARSTVHSGAVVRSEGIATP